MRGTCYVTVLGRLGLLAALACVAACTDYGPVRMGGNQTWLEARREAGAEARARAGTSLVEIDASGRTRHVVMPGESVSLLAKKYGVSQAALIDANDWGVPIGSMPAR